MLQSDLVIDIAKIRRDAVPEVTQQFNGELYEKTQAPKWWEVGVAKYRKMREAGETTLPAPVMLDGTSFEIPSREPGRNVPCRVMRPDGDVPVKGIVMHIHGGGWVLMNERFQDPFLKALANGTSVIVVSVGYRLAPEHPFPQAPEDCFDVAEWLVDNAEKQFNAPFQFIAGESAGGHLGVLSAFHLQKTHPSFELSGLVLTFGVYDLTRLPSYYQGMEERILTKPIMDKYLEAFCPGMSMEQLKAPEVSPFYHDLNTVRLPPAIFSCGLEDLILDDSVLMATKWQLAGGEGILKLYPGATHAFIFFPQDKVPAAKECIENIVEFMGSKLK